MNLMVTGSNECFVMYAANGNGFKLGYKMILFMGTTHVNDPYKGTTPAVCVLNVDNHLFSFT